MVLDGYYSSILSVDYADVVISQLQRAHADLPQLQYATADARWGDKHTFCHRSMRHKLFVIQAHIIVSAALVSTCIHTAAWIGRQTLVMPGMQQDSL